MYTAVSILMYYLLHTQVRQTSQKTCVDYSDPVEYFELSSSSDEEKNKTTNENQVDILSTFHVLTSRFFTYSLRPLVKNTLFNMKERI